MSPPVTGKSFRFVSCMRARGGMLGQNASQMVHPHLPFSLFGPGGLPFPLVRSSESRLNGSELEVKSQ